MPHVLQCGEHQVDEPPEGDEVDTMSINEASPECGSFEEGRSRIAWYHQTGSGEREIRITAKISKYKKSNKHINKFISIYLFVLDSESPANYGNVDGG